MPPLKPLVKTSVPEKNKQPKDHSKKVSKETTEQKTEQKFDKAVKLARNTPPSQASQGGAGANKSPSKGEAVPMTAASYSIGMLGNKPPDYPERARRNEFEGRVLLRVKVSAKGTSETIAVKTSSGYDLLDEAARAAVKAWRFTPAKRGGIAVASTIDVPIVFRLTSDP